MPRRTPAAPMRPRALRAGDTLGIVAPAGPVADRAEADAGVRALERLGFRVRCDARVFESAGYLAGDDAARAGELLQHLADREIAGVVALRGGYGSARLIPHLSRRGRASNCKVFMGFSDLTTLHLYWRQRWRWATVHGPMLTSPALQAPPAGASEHLVRLWTDPGYRPRLHFAELETWHPGVAEGVLVGGCLSLVVASLGTRYEIDTRGAILFLEDLGEPPYRLDRMLTQLRQAGKLDPIAGLVLGSFSAAPTSESPAAIFDTLREVLGWMEVPVLANFPSGHGPANWALPLNLPARLDATARALEILEPLTRPAHS